MITPQLLISIATMEEEIAYMRLDLLKPFLTARTGAS